MSQGKELSGDMWGELYNWGHQEQAVLTLSWVRFHKWLLYLLRPCSCYTESHFWRCQSHSKKLKGKYKDAHHSVNFFWRNFTMLFWHLTWDLLLWKLRLCLLFWDVRTAEWFAFLRTNVHVVKSVHLEFVQPSTMVSFSICGTLCQVQLLQIMVTP